MARKLDDTNESNGKSGIGRRDYVKAGMLSTMAGAGLVGGTTSAAAGSGNSLQIIGRGELAIYDVTVSGDLFPAPQTTIDTGDNISGTNAEGTVRDEVHWYRFDGDLLDVRLDGEAAILRNGEPLDESGIENR